jgi:hypothetical protein
MDFYTKRTEMKTSTQKLIKWKNLMMISLLVLSMISIASICISAAIFNKLKNLEYKLYLIEEKNIK